MIEFWSVVGLAGIDEKFRDDLFAAAGSKERKDLYDYLLKERNFRLSRYEIEEIRHLLRCAGVKDGFEKIGACWSKTCSVGQTYKEEYDHPNPGWRDTHIVAIDIATAECKKLG